MEGCDGRTAADRPGARDVAGTSQMPTPMPTRATTPSSRSRRRGPIAGGDGVGDGLRFRARLIQTLDHEARTADKVFATGGEKQRGSPERDPLWSRCHVLFVTSETPKRFVIFVIRI
jgi:hypothetical protein